MEYIQASKTGTAGCIFCPLSAAGDDRTRLVLYRGRTNLVVMNRYPYNPGHLLIVPHPHAGRLSDVAPEVLAEMMTVTAASVDCLERVLKAEGVNCGFNLGRVAGAGVADHLHLHVVPRWSGDTNYLPILAGTKSMPEYILETYDRLLPTFQKG